MKILQDLKGAYYLVKEYTPLAEEEAKKIVAEAKLIAEDVQHNLQMAEQFLQAEAAKVSGQGAPATPAQGEQSTVTTDPAPTPPADQPQTQPVDQGQTPSADPSQQVPAPTLSTDPNPQPAADPNQVQTQPDPSAAPQLQ